VVYRNTLLHQFLVSSLFVFFARKNFAYGLKETSALSNNNNSYNNRVLNPFSIIVLVHRFPLCYLWENCCFGRKCYMV